MGGDCKARVEAQEPAAQPKPGQQTDEEADAGPADEAAGPSRGSQPPINVGNDTTATSTGQEPLPTFVIKRAKSKGAYKITTHLSVVVQLPGTASMQGVELEVSTKRVRLDAPSFAPLDIELPQLVQEDAVVAKFSKKKGQLTVKVPVRASN